VSCSRGGTQFVKGRIVTSTLRRTTGAVIVALSLAFSAAGAAMAQEQYEQQKLESFVVAALAVNELVEEWTPRIQSAQDETEAAQLRDQANSELVDAISQSNGITVEEYREISQAAQADPALMARISEIFDDVAPPENQ
jgi:mannitol-specific phosphotransferase system IIBC component